MNEQICQVVSEEELVAYAEGDLPPERAEQIEAHMADCQKCQTMLEALERSLHLTQVIWRTGDAQWPKTHIPSVFKSNRWSYRKIAVIAAGILLVLGIGLTWRLMSGTSEMSKEPTVAEIEAAANRAAMASQMLAVADLLSSQPGGVQFAVKRYNDVITSFPETEQSTIAKRHLQNLLERR